MDNQIEEIKNKLSVLDVVGSYLKLTKTGINYRGVCPFHSEKTPSFFVSPNRQMWHCFGCGKGGSIFDFVMGIEGVEFGDALRLLASKAGVQLKRENIQLRTERQRLYEVCQLACLFFEKQLEASAAGKEAKAYLQKRGINQDSLKKWRLGYSPDTWNGLTDFLVGNGYTRQEVVKAGLAIEKEGRKDSYDRFRGRIMFPVFGLNSEVLGFGGRVFKQVGETAKYINTPQTLLYNKSGVLYGLNHAKLPARKQGYCVVTEGYTDVIMCHQAGFENTVAASGTALTEQHVALLKRYCENLVLAFDMDVAGDSATKRGIHLAQEQGFNIKVIESYGFGEGKSDPADIILKDSKIWEESVSKAKGIMDYYFDSAFSAFDKTKPEGKKEISTIVLPAIKNLQNKIEQSYWVQKLSGMLDIKEEAILEELAKIKSDSNLRIHSNVPNDLNTKTDNVEIDKSLGVEARKKILEEKVISLVLKDPGHAGAISESHYALFSQKIGEFFKELKKIMQNYDFSLGQSQTGEAKDNQLPRDFKTVFEDVLSLKNIEGQEAFDAEFKNFLATLAIRAEVHWQEDGKEEVELCLLQLKSIALKKKLSSISEDIKKAEESGNHNKVKSLVDEFKTLTKEL